MSGWGAVLGARIIVDTPHFPPTLCRRHAGTVSGSRAWHVWPRTGLRYRYAPSTTPNTDCIVQGCPRPARPWGWGGTGPPLALHWHNRLGAATDRCWPADTSQQHIVCLVSSGGAAGGHSPLRGVGWVTVRVGFVTPRTHRFASSIQHLGSCGLGSGTMLGPGLHR